MEIIQEMCPKLNHKWNMKLTNTRQNTVQKPKIEEKGPKVGQKRLEKERPLCVI